MDPELKEFEWYAYEISLFFFFLNKTVGDFIFVKFLRMCI